MNSNEGRVRDQTMSSESRTQQEIRLQAARQGNTLWRNNVGATPAKEQHTCPYCNRRFEVRKTPVRYGLANDSNKLNQSIKSADLIGITKRVIQPHEVGMFIGQFTSIEVKPGGWEYTGRGREPAQAAWADLVRRMGGLASFETGVS